MKEVFIINVHSFVDVITNSSTELFVLDSDKTLETITALVKAKEAEYPPDYGHYVSVSEVEQCDIEWVMDSYINVDESIEHLKMLGYTIIPPDPAKPSPVKYYKITSERGGMDPRLYKFITSTFNIIRYTTEA